MTRLEIYSDTLTCVLYYMGTIVMVQSFPDWDTLLHVVFDGIPSWLSVVVKS
jgi:hypothetical protein